MAYNKGERSDSPMKRRNGGRRRRKVCVYRYRFQGYKQAEEIRI